MTDLFKTNILSIESHTDHLRSFKISVPSSINWDFLPGQYIDVALLNDPIKFNGFTLTSTPDVKSYFTVSVKKTDNEFSDLLFKHAVGDEIFVRGPAGDFTVDFKDISHTVLIGGGIGVTPFLSMYRTANKHPSKPTVFLFHSAKWSQELLFKDELQQLAEKNSRLSYFCSLTEERSNDIKIGRFTIKEILTRLIGYDLENFHFFICGPGSMNTEFEKNLISEGIAKNRIHLESYYEP